MADLLATFSYDTNLAGDTVGPTLSFAVHKPGALVAGDATLVLETLEESLNFPAAGAGASLTSTFSQSVSRATDSGVAKVFDITDHLDGSPHGSPIATKPIEADAAQGGGAMASQLAVVITLRARNALAFPVEVPPAPPGEPNVQRPRARRSGRIFWGPINSFSLGASPDGEPRPGAALRAILLAGCEGIQDNLNAEGFAWCVWSRKNEAMSVIERVEVDDSFDVMRSRKPLPTIREQRTFAPVPDLALGA